MYCNYCSTHLFAANAAEWSGSAQCVSEDTRGAAEKFPGTHTPLGRNSDRFAPERSDGTTGEHPLIVQRSGPDNISRMAETCQKSHVNVSMENPGQKLCGGQRMLTIRIRMLVET